MWSTTSAWIRRLIAVVAIASGLTAAGAAEAPRERSVFRGACYCKAAGELHCAGNLTEAECRKRCNEELCDEWFWLERLACWNWGYGG